MPCSKHEKLLKYTLEEDDKKTRESEISELKMASDLVSQHRFNYTLDLLSCGQNPNKRFVPELLDSSIVNRNRYYWLHNGGYLNRPLL